MSTNLECLFVTNEKNQVYYLLENYDAPKNAFDWRLFSTCYGPFKNFDIAYEHLCDNHANPGGYGEMDYQTGKDNVLDTLIAQARPAQRNNRYSRYLSY